MQITYQKRNGNIIQRFRETTLLYKIGDTTSMGWKVLNVEYEYNKKYYPEYQYRMLIRKKIQRYATINQIKEKSIIHIKTLLYYIIGIIIINLIKIL